MQVYVSKSKTVFLRNSAGEEEEDGKLNATKCLCIIRASAARKNGPSVKLWQKCNPHLVLPGTKKGKERTQINTKEENASLYLRALKQV